jgi:DNA-binding SARP family transcriptional activator
MRLFVPKIYLTVIFLILLHVQSSYAQSYGLGFYSHEVVQDKRTSLELDLAKVVPAKNGFTLSFDLSFLSHQTIYFGYILRLVNDANQNVDLVYDNLAVTKRFKIIVGDKLTKIGFDIKDAQLYDRWNNLQISVDIKGNKITVNNGKAVYTEANIRLKPDANYKLLFGANTYKQFQTTDLPPMKLRNVKISQQGKLVGNWPLNNCSGTVATELVGQNNGKVVNPLWVKARHRNWQLEKEFTVAGIAGTSYDAATESVHIITGDSLITYSPNQTNHIASNSHHSGLQQLVPGDQAIYLNNRLYYIFMDQKVVMPYNISTHKWEGHLKDVFPETNYGHLNKFYSPADSSLYIVGGYGQLIYKDSVLRYDLMKHSWERVKVKGDAFTPRYLAGLGTSAKGDTAYIIGGYGSATGQQILNPRNLYDVMRYTVKDRTFKKLFTLDFKGEDFVFANSLVVNTAKKTFYGLIFPQHKYKSHLQLIAGSLNSSSYKAVGGTIPFLFHDAYSFADLYFCQKAGKFLAVTLYKDGNQTHVKIYSLLSPPEPLSDGDERLLSDKSLNWWYLGFAGIVVVAVAGWFLTKRSAKPVLNKVPDTSIKPQQPAASIPEHVESEDTLILAPVQNSVATINNAIFLFGDLQLFTADGHEITKAFTPLLKELFLIILLYSVKWGRGVSSEKLNEILWFDKSEKSARNNRSVNIAKLKTLLDKMGHCHLSKDTGYWKIEIDYQAIFVDYHQYLDIVSNKNKLDKQKILQLTRITQRGNFLSNIEYEWLDAFKSDVSNEIIDSYLQFANSIKIADDPEFIIKLANDIFFFDPVNEEAMILKCKALSHLGKHSLAKTTYENFNKEYKGIYGENFEKNFHSVVE